MHVFVNTKLNMENLILSEKKTYVIYKYNLKLRVQYTVLMS